MPDMMGKMDIAFPHLGIYLKDVPQSITIGSFSIALYGICIAAAMLAGILLAAHIAKKTGWDPNIIWDISIWLIFWDAYKDNLLQIFNLRAGGLAIYGGIIACVIVVFVYCKVRRVNPFRLLDTAAYGLVLGQIIGRWGNFFNREVFGGYTDSLLAMRLPVAMVRSRDITEAVASHIAQGTNYIQVHPTFLYEGLWNLGLLILMLLWTGHKKFEGEITLLYFDRIYPDGSAVYNWDEDPRIDRCKCNYDCFLCFDGYIYQKTARGWDSIPQQPEVSRSVKTL